MPHSIIRAVIPIGFAVFALNVATAHASKGYSVLYNFCQGGYPCANGSFPGELIADTAGDLFGTTQLGGIQTDYCGGCGTVFEISSNDTQSVLYEFCQQAACADGENPNAPLVKDNSGNLYGTTLVDGANMGGTIFKIDPRGVETVLYSFCDDGCGAGQNPYDRLIMDKKGNFYGTAVGGSHDCGVVFELNPKGIEKVLHTFGSVKGDGCVPLAGLLSDEKNNLFGTTYRGGQEESGTVFEITKDGQYNIIYSFCSQQNCVDGEYPQARLAEDRAGTLYGTTYGGGANSYGTVFKVTSSGAETVLYSFCVLANCADGQYPVAPLLVDGNGNEIYGTTAEGGGDGFGVVFELSSKGEAVLESFDGSNGADGSAPLIKAKGWFYGATGRGGTYGYGTVFKLGTKGSELR